VGVCSPTKTLTVQATNISNLDVTWRAKGVVGGTADSLSIIVDQSQTVVVTVTDNSVPNGCSVTETIDVFLNDLSVNLGADTTVCFPSGKPYNLVARDVAFQQSLIAYRFFSTAAPSVTISTDSIAQVDKAGVYVVEVRNTETGCSVRDSILVNFTPEPDFELGGYTPGDCLAEATLRISQLTNEERAAIVWQGPGIVSIGSDSLSAVVNVSGTYAVTVSNASCSTTETIEVFLNDIKVSVGENSSVNVCENSFPYLAQGTFESNLPGLTSWWENATDPGIRLSTGGTLNVPAAGTYFFYVENPATSCVFVDTLTITSVPQPQFRITGHDPKECVFTETLTVELLNAIGLPSIKVSGAGVASVSNNGQTIQVNQSGFVVVTVTDSLSIIPCPVTDSIFVQLNPTFAQAGKDTTVCETEFPLTIRGSYTTTAEQVGIRWNKLGQTAVLSTELELNAPEAGTYVISITPTDANICPDKDTVVIKSRPLPIVSLTKLAGTCKAQDTLRVSVPNIANPIITWQQGEAEGLIALLDNGFRAVVNKTGTYNVSVQGDSVCQPVSASLFVQLADLPDLSFLADTSKACQTNAILLRAQVPEITSGYRYELFDATTNQLLAEGVNWEITYDEIQSNDLRQLTGRVTTPWGCSIEKTLFVQFTVPPKAQILPLPEQVCAGTPIPLQGTGGSNLQWLVNGQLTHPDSFNTQQPGTYQVILEARNDSLCNASFDTTQVVVNRFLVIPAIADTLARCEDESLFFNLRDRDDPSNTLYEIEQLLPPSNRKLISTEVQSILGFDDFEGAGSFSPLILEIRKTNPATQCVTRKTVVVSFSKKPTPTFAQLPDTVCLNTAFSGQLLGADSFSILEPQGIIVDSLNQFSYTPNLAESLRLIVAGFNLNSCGSPRYDTTFVEVSPIPSVRIQGKNSQNEIIFCEGDSINVSATGGLRYEWSSGQRGSKVTLNPQSDSTWYRVTGFGLGQCPKTDSALVIVIPRIRPELNPTACFGEVLTIGQESSVPATYFWPHNGDTTATIQVTIDDTFTVRVTTFNGCTYEVDITTTFNPIPTSRIVSDTLLCFTEVGEPEYADRQNRHALNLEVVDRAAQGTLYYTVLGAENDSVPLALVDRGQIAPDEQNAQIFVEQAGYYEVRLENQFRCFTTNRITVGEVCAPLVKVPKTFSPNGDGLNDLFTVLASSVDWVRIRVYQQGTTGYDLLFDERYNRPEEAGTGKNWFDSQTMGWTGDAATRGWYYYEIEYEGQTIAPQGQGQQAGTQRIIPLRQAVQGIVELRQE